MKNLRWLSLSGLIILVDQLTKYWALANLLPYDPNPLLPILNFTLAYNTGAAFSLLSTAGDWHHWFFVSFSLFVSLFLIRWLFLLPLKGAAGRAVGLSLVIGGAIGNLIDRLRLGHVVDFIALHYKTYHFPIFNIADCAICVGVIILLWFMRETAD